MPNPTPASATTYKARPVYESSSPARGVMTANAISAASITMGLKRTMKSAPAPLRVELGMAASVHPAAMAAVM
ncbi:hypothetical protein D3C85_1458550 [compost metagenome]